VSTPEKVRTTDGMVWELRAETRGGLALYALEGVCSCPPYVMATLMELAEHGIQSAELAAVVAEVGALPMPAGDVPQLDGITRLTAPTQALRVSLEDPHDSPLHRDWRIPHDLPELGGQR